MKKKIFALALVMLGLCGTTMYASNDDNCCKKGERQECKAEKFKHKGDKQKFNPFEGIQLTAEQQTKIDALRKEMMTARKAKKQDDKARVEGCNAKKEYLAKVKEILTPEQYVTFLENMASKPGMHHKAMMKPGKKGDKGQRHDKCPRSDK